MDVNGVPFHLLQGERDWRGALASDHGAGLEWDRECNSVGLRQVTTQFSPAGGGEVQNPQRRRGADCDQFGNWYWIDSTETALLVSPCPRPQMSVFWTVANLSQSCVPKNTDLFQPIAPEPPANPELRLRGLAVTSRHYLVVGTVNPGGLLIFDLHGGGSPVRYVWPQAMGFEPFDFSGSPDGGVWLLGRTRAEWRVWKLDAYLRVEGADPIDISPGHRDQFQAAANPLADSGEEPCVFASGIPVLLESPRAIETLSTTDFLLLDTPDGSLFSTVYLFRGPQETNSADLGPELLGEVLESPSLIRANDLAFTPGQSPKPGVISGKLYLAGENGDQAYALDLTAGDGSFELEFVREYYPLRRYSGLGLVCCGGWPHYDFQGQRWMPLSALPGRRYVVDGELRSLVLDGRIPGCIWHRTIFDGWVPDGTRVEFWTRANDEREALPHTEWRQEPAAYLRSDGPEVAFYSPFSKKELEQSGAGTWELLVQAARGRYLEIRIRFSGDGPRTPRIRSLRIYYQRFSYLERYLPDVYRQEPVSASFLERYLANVEGTFTAAEDRIAKSEGLLDERITPAAYLEWLAGWFDFVFDVDWEESRRRLFLRNASLLFQWRGTVIGMLAVIRLAIDPCPTDAIFDELRAGKEPAAGRLGNAVRIVERFLSRNFGGVTIGDPTVPAQPGLSGAGAAWTPSQGAGPLHLLFQEFLSARYSLSGSPALNMEPLNSAWGTSFTSLQEVRLSPVLPANSAKAADWRAFLSSSLAFTYAPVTSSDTLDYQSHLERRYGSTAALNAAYQLFGANSVTQFTSISLPGEDDFPQSGPPLFDWIGFVSLAVPIRETAHQFTVLIPTTPAESAEDRQRRLSRVEAVVRREKPGHTEFEIKPFWALFQVGTARLGLDTTLGDGSRFTGIELGRTAAGEGYLAFGHPWNVGGRSVAGRDTAGDFSLEHHNCHGQNPPGCAVGKEMRL